MPYDPTSTGSVSAKDVAGYLQGAAGNPTDLAIGGLPGATAGYRLVGATTTGIPTGGTFAVGDVVLGVAEGQYYACTTAGSPGTFKNVARDPLMDALSLKTWTANPSVITANNVATSQSIYAAILPTVAGQVYTGVKLWVINPGTSTAPTNFFVGLATNGTVGDTGAMLTQSGDLKASTSLTTAGPQLFPFSATYTETATGLRAIVILQNGTFAGTNVAFGKATQIGAGTGVQGLSYITGTSQTALPANAANLPSAYATASGVSFWAGLY